MEIYIVIKKDLNHQTNMNELLKAFCSIVKEKRNETNSKIYHNICKVDLENEPTKDTIPTVEYRECSYCKKNLTEGYVIFPNGSSKPNSKRLICITGQD